MSQSKVRIAELASQVSALETRLARSMIQAREGTVSVDRLTAEVETLKGQKARLEKQLSEALNAGSNSAPSTLLKAKWVRRYVYRTPTAVCIEIANPADADANISYAYSQFTVVDGGRFVYPPRLHTPGYSIQIDTPLLYGDLNPGDEAARPVAVRRPCGVGPHQACLGHRDRGHAERHRRPAGIEGSLRARRLLIAGNSEVLSGISVSFGG